MQLEPDQSIRPATEEDLPGILKVLSFYNFKVLDPREGAPVDDGFQGEIQLYNEVSQIDLADGFVAVRDQHIVGFSHFKYLTDRTAKTTLISVDPDYAKHGYGRALQLARMRRAHQQGCIKLVTYCDNERGCVWYRRHFGYELTGSDVNSHRLHFFVTSKGPVWGVHYGFYENDTVTILETDLDKFFAAQPIA